MANLTLQPDRIQDKTQEELQTDKEMDEDEHREDAHKQDVADHEEQSRRGRPARGWGFGLSSKAKAIAASSSSTAPPPQPEGFEDERARHRFFALKEQPIGLGIRVVIDHIVEAKREDKTSQYFRPLIANLAEIPRSELAVPAA